MKIIKIKKKIFCCASFITVLRWKYADKLFIYKDQLKRHMLRMQPFGTI